MITWLDHYIRGARKGIPEPMLRQMPDVRTDLDAMRLMVAATIHQAQASPDLASTPEMASKIALYTAIAPLILPGGAPDPLCIQLTLDLAADLSEAKAPDVSDPDHIIQDRRVVYLDLPHRAVLVGHLEIRALAIKATPGVTPLVTVVLTEYGQDSISGRYGWDWGREGTVYGSAIEDVDTEVMRVQVEDLARLSILYWISGEGRTDLPHVPEDRLVALRPDKQSARQKTHSLFRVVSLASPHGRFGRTGSEHGGSGWKLGVRSRVRGHFRWQPHGPERKLRRLQWIAAHERGPVGGETRPDLHVLRNYQAGSAE